MVKRLISKCSSTICVLTIDTFRKFFFCQTPIDPLYQYPEGAWWAVRESPPLHAAVYLMERLRCNLCGELLTAKTPQRLRRFLPGAIMLGKTF
jgi:hypothetical protein